ncbi:MAG: hypothetical protein KJ726_05260 [Verrucomicrobia bacterium]|nr:hypothetical protein [Verrucomicrobiota bacterium]MBU1909437.1 hypothetical protein [Verrucomicrobiota bacterium]
MVKPADQRVDIGERRAQAGCGVTGRQARWAVVAFFAVALLLNGHHIHEEATRRAYGFWWTAWVTATRPLNWISTVTRLSAPRTWIENAFGQTEDTP